MDNDQLCEKLLAKCDSPVGFPARYGAFRPPLRFLTKDSNSYCESFQVGAGLVMLVMNVGIEKPVWVRLRGQNIIEFHYRLVGSLEMKGRWGALQMREPSMLLWFQPKGCDDVDEVIGNGATREVSVSLYCDLHWLEGYIPENAAWLSGFISRSSPMETNAPVYRIYAPYCETMDILQEIVRCPFRTELRSLYARSKALELLCHTFRALHGTEFGSSKTEYLRERDRRCVNRARGILEREFATPPEIDTLARRVGMSSTRLRFGFKVEFGQTIADFVRATRLNHAKELLMSPNTQVSHAALAVGYKHHSSFTAAFARHFGSPPRTCRSVISPPAKRGKAFRSAVSS